MRKTIGGERVSKVLHGTLSTRGASLSLATYHPAHLLSVEFLLKTAAQHYLGYETEARIQS